MKTIAQIAAEIGVSRQAVYKKIKQEPLSTSLQGKLSTKGHVVVTSVDGEKLIKKAFLRKSLSTLSTKSVDTLVDSVDSKLTVSLQSQIDLLTEQNIELRTQLDEERKINKEQFDQLNEHAKNFAQLAQNAQQLAQNAQQLHLGDMMPRIAGSANTQEKVQGEPKEKAGIIQKIFGKKKRLDAE